MPTREKYRRTISGFRMEPKAGFNSKRDAQKRAEKYRDRGYPARVIKDSSSGKWEVWSTILASLRG